MPAIETTDHALPHGISLHCRCAGPADGPLMVLLHGFPEGSFVWDEWIQHFAQPANGGYRCVAPSLRGYEQSSQPAEVRDYRASHLVADVVALIDGLHPHVASRHGQAVVLVGHDWGGAVAWGLAATHPDRLKRLIILNAPHPATFQRELASNPAQQAASAYMGYLARADAAERLAENDFARLWPFFDAMGASNGPHAWLTPTLRDRYRHSWLQGLRGPCAYYAASPLRPPTAQDPGAAAVQLPDALCRVNVPTQVIWGLNDTALRPELLEGLERWVPGVRIDRLPGASHWLLHEMPKAVIERASEFLNQELSSLTQQA